MSDDKVFILFSVCEYDDWEPHEVLLAVFKNKPTDTDLKKIPEFSRYINNGYSSVPKAYLDSILPHILNGGGRRNKELSWYSLKEVEMGVRYYE